MAKAKRAAAAGPVEGPWALPEGWRWERLGDVCEPSQYGWTTKAASSGSIKFLRTTDISSGRVDWATVPYCAEAPCDVDRYRVKTDEILISRAGSVGKSFLIDTADEAVFASYLIRFRPLSAPRYIHYWLQTDTYWSMITENTAGIAIPNVNASKLSDLPVPMAPGHLREQIVARIDELFDEIDDGEAALARARDDLATWRKALLKAAVTGELTADWRAERLKQDGSPAETGADLLARILADRRRTTKKRLLRSAETFPAESATRSLPDQWAWCEPSQIVGWSSGKFMPDRLMNGGEVPVYGGNGIAGYHDEALVTEPTLVIGRVGHYCGNAYATDGPAWISDNAIYASSVAAGVAVQYLRIVFEQINLRRLAQGGAQPFVSQGLLNSLPIPLPDTEEQVAIVDAVRRALAETANLEGVIEESEAGSSTLRQSILAAAFRGELA